MSFTKKAQGKRTMKKLPIWWGINKTTPEQWFDRWEDFLIKLFEDLGFAPTVSGILRSPRGKKWEKELIFQGANMGPYYILLTRKRKCDYGGDIEVFGPRGKVDQEPNIVVRTTSMKGGHLVMCRTTVGNDIIAFIRHTWELNVSANQESTR